MYKSAMAYVSRQCTLIFFFYKIKICLVCAGHSEVIEGSLADVLGATVEEWKVGGTNETRIWRP